MQVKISVAAVLVALCCLANATSAASDTPDLRGLGNGSVTGTVYNADSTVHAGARVLISPDDTPEPPWAYSQRQTADANGQFRFDDVPGGVYRITFEIVVNSVAIRMHHTGPVTVVADQTTEADLVLPWYQGVIEGYVRDADGTPMEDLDVFASIGEILYQYDPATGLTFAHDITDETGYYSITGLAEGDYRVYTNLCFYGTCLEYWWPDQLDFLDATLVSVRADEAPMHTADFDAPFAPASGEISGTVLDSNGSPFTEAVVEISQWPSKGPWSVQNRTGVAIDGTYRFTELPNRDYVIRAFYWYAGRVRLEEWYGGFSDADSSIVVSVVGGESVVGIDFEMDSSVGIDDPVVDDDAAIKLLGNFPNPFMRATSIEFRLADAALTTVTLFDVLGRRLEVLHDGVLTSGEHRFDWSGFDSHGAELRNGMYLYQVVSGAHAETGRMILSR
ncbi:MAG: carboxypeptidase regulatory-like domain-containing protein [Bacteroidetes bacterium]|nr:carboxypeptidase regulatory-like domain-containing protein [Bacteroidota bacterium]